MPKEIRCAKCGRELAQKMTAFKGRVVTVIAPHECEPYQTRLDLEMDVKRTEVEAEKLMRQESAKSPTVDEVFDSFPFMKDLKRAQSEATHPGLPSDSRKSRDEIVSSAPAGLQELIRKQAEGGAVSNAPPTDGYEDDEGEEMGG